jgi:uncharacterized protein (DUF952 family)
MSAVAFSPVTIVTNTANTDYAFGGSLLGALMINQKLRTDLERTKWSGSTRFYQHLYNLLKVTVSTKVLYCSNSVPQKQVKQMTPYWN